MFRPSYGIGREWASEHLGKPLSHNNVLLKRL